MATDRPVDSREEAGSMADSAQNAVQAESFVRDGYFDEWVYVNGYPTKQEFVDFVLSHSVQPVTDTPEDLGKEWDAALQYVESLEDGEGALADSFVVRDPPAAAEPYIRALLADRAFLSAFSSPIRVGMVNLESLMIHQKHVNFSFARMLGAGLTKNTSIQDLLRFCIPRKPDLPRVIKHPTANGFLFSSTSHDFRILGGGFLGPDQIDNLQHHGHVTDALLLPMGYGRNCFMVLKMADRAIVYNGSHRACALYMAGIRNAPCIIADCAGPGDLAAHLEPNLIERVNLYFRSVRPPLVKDYLDSQIGRRVRAHRTQRQVRVTVEETLIPIAPPGV